MLNPHFHNTDPTRSLPISLCPNIMQVLSYKKKWIKKLQWQSKNSIDYPVQDTAMRFQIRCWPKLNKSFNCPNQNYKLGKPKRNNRKNCEGHSRTYVIIDRSNAVKKQLAIISATNGWVWEGGNGKVSTGWRLVTKT